MKPTPNDTKRKQFLTALAMTVLFALGILSVWGLFALSHWLRRGEGMLNDLCAGAVFFAAIVDALIVLGATLISMYDWMKSTVQMKSDPPEIPVTVATPPPVARQIERQRQRGEYEPSFSNCFIRPR